MSGGTAGMNDSFGDAFVIEVGDLLSQMVVLDEHRTAGTGLERMVGVGQSAALGRRVIATLLPLRILLIGAGCPPWEWSASDRSGRALLRAALGCVAARRSPESTTPVFRG